MKQERETEKKFWKEASRYQLRQAAEAFWLLDMEQEGIPYRKPLMLNQAGAEIWLLFKQHKSSSEIAAALCSEYGISLKEALEDTEEFLEKLQKYGIFMEEEGNGV